MADDHSGTATPSTGTTSTSKQCELLVVVDDLALSRAFAWRWAEEIKMGRRTDEIFRGGEGKKTNESPCFAVFYGRRTDVVSSQPGPPASLCDFAVKSREIRK